MHAKKVHPIVSDYAKIIIIVNENQNKKKRKQTVKTRQLFLLHFFVFSVVEC